MRILNLDAPIMVQGFKELGHDVFCIGYHDDADLKVSQPRSALRLFSEVCATGFIPDIVFWCDGSNLPYFPRIEELPCPTAFYSIDTYCHHWHFGFANAFDAVFVAQKDHMDQFPEDLALLRWLPLFARHAPEPIAWEERDIPVSFVGTRKHQNNPDREAFLREFRYNAPLVLYTGDYVPIFSRSCIALNQTACSEINFRCFEAMACGAALLMERCLHGMGELFKPGENILPVYTRNQPLQAARIARKELARPEQLREVAERGREYVLRNHMARHRAAEIVSLMEGLLWKNAAQKRLQELHKRQQFIATSYGMIGHDLLGRLSPAYSEYYLSVCSSMKERMAS